MTIIYYSALLQESNLMEQGFQYFYHYHSINTLYLLFCLKYYWLTPFLKGSLRCDWTIISALPETEHFLSSLHVFEKQTLPLVYNHLLCLEAPLSWLQLVTQREAGSRGYLAGRLPQCTAPVRSKDLAFAKAMLCDCRNSALKNFLSFSCGPNSKVRMLLCRKGHLFLLSLSLLPIPLIYNLLPLYQDSRLKDVTQQLPASVHPYKHNSCKYYTSKISFQRNPKWC